MDKLMFLKLESEPMKNTIFLDTKKTQEFSFGSEIEHVDFCLKTEKSRSQGT